MSPDIIALTTQRLYCFNIHCYVTTILLLITATCMLDLKTSCHLCCVVLHHFVSLLTKYPFYHSISIMVSSPSPFIYPGDESLTDYPSSPTPYSPPSTLRHAPSPSPLPFASINVALRFSPPVPSTATLADTTTVEASSSATISTSTDDVMHISSVNVALRWNSAAEAKCKPKRRSSKNGEVSSHLRVVKSKLVPVKSHRRSQKKKKTTPRSEMVTTAPRTSTPAAQLKQDADLARRLFTEFTHNFFHPTKKTV